MMNTKVAHVSLSLILALTLSASRLRAGDTYTFHSGGQAHSIVMSDTEMFVRTEPGKATNVRRAITESDPHCRVSSIPWTVGCDHYAIVEMPKVDKAARVAMRAMPGVVEVRPVYRFDDTESPMLSSGNVVVQLDKDMTAAERTQFFKDYKVALVDTLSLEGNIYTVRPTSTGMDDDVRCASAMYRDHRTVFAHPDFIVETRQKQVFTQLEDEFFSRQWHLNNTGQDLASPGADINVEEAWRFTFGEDILFGIFDDAVDVEHEDLSPNYTLFGHDAFLAEEGRLAPLPRNFDDRHGTAVMGLAGADANTVGVVGAAPGARFTASRGLNDPVSLGQIASVYTFARQQEVDVHINSWGLPFTPNSRADVIVTAIRGAFREGRDGLGMVVVFAAGNFSRDLGFDDDLSTLPEVIGVGSSTGSDRLSSFSNFGVFVDVLAPGGEFEPPNLVTTDNRDDGGFVDPGYNTGGSGTDTGDPDLPDGNYTNSFNGTSAACPVAAGVAAMVLSINPSLTASQVRVVLEQTCDKVDPANAAYGVITERSLTHAYGRVNAGAAVEAAREANENGGFTWPDRLSSLGINGTTLTWTVGDDIRELDTDNNDDTPPEEAGELTVRTLVLESAQPFDSGNFFRPEDFERYDIGEAVTEQISVVQDDDSTTFRLSNSSGTRYYALFPANTIGRYGFGVSIDTDGNVDGIGGLNVGAGGVPVDSTERAPRVSIDVSPLAGLSPLTVNFRGNAISNNSIDSMMWNFDDEGANSMSPTTSHRYIVTGQSQRRFFPSFMVTDENGNSGIRSVAVDVTGDQAGAAQLGDVNIRISLPGSIGSDVTQGESPFTVNLSVEGTPADGMVQDIQWDLGDGTTASTIAVPHTYINETRTPRTFPIGVQITTRTATDLFLSQAATRFITVLPNSTQPPADETTDDGTDNGGVDEPPATADPCAAGFNGMMAFAGLLCLGFVRKRFR